MNRFKAFLARLLNIRYEAAYYTSSRRRIQGQPQDARLDLDKCAREQLVNLSRHWEANSALATKLGLIFEQYTVGEDGLPVSPTTSSPEFNDAALEFWLQSEPYLDIGSTQGFRAMTAVAAWRWFFDGESYFIKTRGESNFPRLQLIESHRIQTPDALKKREDINDGVEFDPRTGRALARYIAEGADAKNFRRIEENSIIPILERSRARMHRGLPMLTPSLNDFADLEELQHFEMLAAKDAAEITNVIKNQAGELPADQMRARRYSESVTLNTDATATEDKVDFYQNKVGGRTVVMRTGDTLEQFQSNRPNVASQQYWDFLTSKICAGCGISKLLVYPWSMQGTVTRADLDSQAAFFRTRSAVMIQAVQEAYKYVIGWAINTGKLKNAPKDWYKVSIRPPRSPNVDTGRNSTAMLAELEAGATNYELIYGPMGLDWRQELRKLDDQLKFVDENLPRLAKHMAARFETQPTDTEEPQPTTP